MTQRDKMLRVRFSESEWKTLEALAEKAGLSKSALVRTSLERSRIYNRKDAKAKVAMLNRINANLNMIAKWANIHQDNADVIEVIAALMSIDRSVKSLASDTSDDGDSAP